MNQDNILAIVAFAGGIAVSLLEANRNSKFLIKQTDDALAGKPTTFHTGARSIGKSYYQYQEVVLNYTGADAEKPNGMCGKVQPFREGEMDGIKWAYFTYDIDSGD
jgi:hypothetical protein